MRYTFHTPRLTLRPLALSDVDTEYAYSSVAENTAYMMMQQPHRTKADTLAFLTKVDAEWNKDVPSFYEFAIERNGTHIGAVCVYLDESGKTGELGWVVHRDYWRQGIATEAALAMVRFATDTLRVHTIIATCDARNVPSQKLMRKIGLQLESDDGMRTYPNTGETVRECLYTMQTEHGC